MAKFNLIAPLGGFGNHVRWLLLLDPSFKFNIKLDNSIKFNFIIIIVYKGKLNINS